MKDETKSKKAGFPLHIKIKKYKMNFSYHLRFFRRKVLKSWPIILFAFSVVLFLLILIPNIVFQRLPLFGYWPRMFELTGSVFSKKPDNNLDRLIGVSGANIEIGGYKSVTDNEGKFVINFISKSYMNIPVIIQWAENTVVKRISFEAHQFKKAEVFILDVE